MDGISAGPQKDEVTLRIVVRMPPQHIIKGVSTKRESESSFWGEFLLAIACGLKAACGLAAILKCEEGSFSARFISFSFGFQDLKQQEFYLGSSKVSGKLDWKMLDEAVCQVFKVR